MTGVPSSERLAPVVDGRDPAEAVAAALVVLESGEPVAMATDTVYGLVARAADQAAVARVFELKGRPAERRIAVLVTGAPQAETLVRLSPPARRLAARRWPGPLTLVAARAPTAPACVGDAATIGVRCPDDEALLRLAAAAGPLAATSANRHGLETPATAREVARQLPGVCLVIDGGPRPGAASTVVDVTGAAPAVLRPGPITEAEIAAIWADSPEP